MLKHAWIFLAAICSAGDWATDLNKWRNLVEPRGRLNEALELKNGRFGRGVFASHNVNLCYLKINEQDTEETCSDLLGDTELLLKIPPDKLISP